MIIVAAIPSLDGVDRRALAGMQHYKRIAYPIGDGTKFKVTSIEFVYVTTPHRNQEKIDEAIALHQPASDPKLPTNCQTCLTDYPCETIRVLTEE
jgi:hypothetical protein